MREAIHAEHVQISFPIGNVKNIGLKEYLVRKLKKEYNVKMFTAVQDVSFQIYPGDMLGVIGGNGAGKSTLLKAVSGIIYPNKGWIRVNGKVTALLELSSGFDSQMTVKDNVYLRGAILGFDKEFLDEKYPEIIAFADLDNFQNFTVQQLSSGMKSRLAFAIASLIEPEIIILDEVLSVGDGAFKKKSEKKMLEILDNGVTGIFVSHNTEQVKRLCNKVLWLEKGVQRAFGDDVNGICDAYEGTTSK